MGGLPKKVLKEDDRLPITYVSWNDVQLFLHRLSEIRRGDGYTYRLPTEAEWEYAARGGHRVPDEVRRQPFSFGKDDSRINDYAWSWSNSKIGAQPVGSLKPNPLGLHDIHGNVWEWTVDRYTWDSTKISVEPEFGHPVNLREGKTRVLRGGCWTRNGNVMRSALRARLTPDSDFGNLGVRLVRVPNR